MKLYCDLDGCVADFMLEVSAQIHSLVKGDTIIIKPDDDIPLDCFGYIVSKSLGKKLEKYIEANPDRHSGDGIYPIDEDEAKEKTCRSLIMAIASQEGFFRELLPLDNGLWLAIKDAQGLEFLSATIGEYGHEDKPHWVRTVLQSDVPVIVKGSRHEKIDLVKDNAILIDDNSDTVQAWNKAGGIGLLFTGVNTGEIVASLQELGAL